MKVLEYSDKSVKVQAVKELIQSAGDKIFSVHFVKRSTGKKRKMSCRRKVVKPSYAKPVSGNRSYKRREQDRKNDLITVFDCNSVRYNKKGNMCGRGEWKSIPLDAITRICVNGEIYKVI